jgi:hypothetical protein
MMPEQPNLNADCALALEALGRNALELEAGVEAHLDRCPPCSEARVLLLAMEETPAVAAPQGYYEGLPYRIMRKLPGRRASVNPHAGRWLAAAALLGALGLGTTGFFMGKASQAPVVEAAQPRGLADSLDQTVETPFAEADDPVAQLSELSPKEAETALKRLQAAPVGTTRK